MNDYLISLWFKESGERQRREDDARINDSTFKEAVDILFKRFKQLKGTENLLHIDLTKPTGETFISLGY